MGFRLRIMDLFAVLALVMLLVVTPAYVAQSPTERGLSDGFDLHFPAPRIGDRAELDLVFQWDDDEPVVIEAVRTVEVRAVSPGEVPVHARYVLEETRHPLRVTLPWGDLVVDASTSRTYYDGDGRPVWHGQSHVEAADATTGETPAPRAFVDEWSSVVTDGDSPLNHYFGPPVVFHPSHLALIRREMAENLPGLFTSMQGTSPGDEVHVEMSNQAFVVDGSLYLALDHDPYEAVIGRSDGARAFRGTEGLTDGLTFAGFMADGGTVTTGRWATEEWFMPIGGWQRFTDDAHGLDVWALPRVERGSGDDLPVRHQWRFADGGYTRPAAAQADLRQVTLGSLPELDAELRSGLTLPELVGLLQSDAAVPAVQDAAAGRLVAFIWDAGPVTPATQQASGDVMLPLPAPPADLPIDAGTLPGATARDDWVAAFVAEDGQVRVVNATVETTIEGHRLIQSTDLCDVAPPQQSGIGYVACSFVPLSVTDPGRGVVDPVAALERIAERDGTVELPDRFVYQPLGRYELRIPSYRGNEALSEWQAPFTFGGQDPSTFVWHRADDELPVGIIHWASGSETDEERGGSLWGDTGQLARVHGRAPQPEGEGLGAAAPMTSAAASTRGTPEALDVRSGDAVVGSLLLLGVWALVRAALGLQGGAWASIFAGLYAKIAREDVLDHERRDAIVALIESDPGLTTTEIGERLGMGWGSTVHHLETLRRNRLVVTVRHGHRQHFFRAGSLPERERLRLVYGRDPVYGPFLQTVAGHPGATLTDVVAEVRQGKAGASRTGKRLVALGLLRRERAGREVRFFPHEGEAT